MRDDEFLALQAAKREKKAAKKRKAAGNDGAGALPAPAKLAQPQPAWEDGEWVDPPTQPASEDGEWAAASSSNATPNRSTVDRTSSSTGTDSGSGAITGTLQDKELACIDCGQTFTFTAGEQQWFLEKGYAGGKTRCATCSAAKKARFGEKSGRGTAAAERAAKTTCYTCGQSGHKTKDCPSATCYVSAARIEIYASSRAMGAVV